MSYQSLTNSLYDPSGSGSGITASSTDTLTNKTINYNDNTITNLPGGAEFTATSLKTAAYTAVSGDWVICDANAAAGDIDITLPATPSVGDAVKISLVTAHATRKITINRNSSTIDGGTAAEFQDYNILWKAGDTVTFRCGATSAWLTSDRQIANRFCARAYSNTNQTSTGAGWTTCVLGSESYDYNGNFASNTYTVPIAGRYLLHGQVYQNNLIANRTAVMRFSNSAITVYPFSTNQQIAYNGSVAVNGSGTWDFVVGDTVLLQGYPGSGTTTADIAGGETNTYFSIELISR